MSAQSHKDEVHFFVSRMDRESFVVVAKGSDVLALLTEKVYGGSLGLDFDDTDDERFGDAGLCKGDEDQLDALAGLVRCIGRSESYI